MKNIFIVFLTSFLLWGLCVWYGAEKFSSNLWKTSRVGDKTPLDMREFWDVYNIIGEEYFRDDTIEKQELVYGAIEWMVEALGDRHSEFMTPEVYEKFDELLNGSFEGIWAVVEKVSLGIEVERVLKGSPAKKFWVKPWDIITKTNDEDIVDLGLYDAVEKIKWPAGSTVKLEILRVGERRPIEISVERAEIDIPSVEEEYFDDSELAYIAINQYGETTAQEFRKAIENVKKSWAKGLIIDVRDNGGWYLQTAVQILSEFIPSWKDLVETRYQDTVFNQKYKSVNDGDIFDKKIVVLINAYSASASEITAWTLREYDKAVLVGEKTYGKGSVQQPFDLNSGSMLKLTVAKWFTPNGINIDDEGIQADIRIDFLEEDYENEYDRQLEEAKKILNIYLEKQTIGLTVEAYEETRSSELPENNESVNEKWEE